MSHTHRSPRACSRARTSSRTRSVDLRRGDALERQAIDTVLATVYALMTGDIAHPSDVVARDLNPLARNATSTSRRTSRDASARPIRTIRGGVEYALIVQRAAAIIGSATSWSSLRARSPCTSLGHLTQLALRASAIPDCARARRRPDRRRVAHLARFVRSLRVAGPRHTGARDASQAPRRHRTLSLRPAIRCTSQSRR